MAVEIAGACLHWSNPPLLRGPVSAKTVALAISSLLDSPSRTPHNRTPFLGTSLLIRHSHQRTRAAAASSSSSASLGGQNDGEEEEEEEEFVKRINDLTLKFKIESTAPSSSSSIPWQSIPAERCQGIDGFALQKMERRANSSDLPLSLRILKRKKKKKRESAESTDSACSSVKKAFSSMVFIVREMQSQVIRMRDEALFSSDEFRIQGTLARVHGEIHASFAWLFHRIFSSTPTLMIYLMLLLANFTVFSIAAAPLPPPPPTTTQSPSISIASAIEEESRNPTLRFDSSSTIRAFSVSRSAAVGGSGNGGGGRRPAIAGAADDGCSDRSSSSAGRGVAISFEEVSRAASAWKRMVEETSEMIRATGRHEALMDPDTLRGFVSPVTAEVEPDDLSAYAATELSYRVALAENPDDVLLLSNFAQFLFAVLRDHDRAEEYFKRAIRAEPAEAEALSRYANFLWVARNDLGAAEETFLEAISADPGNSFHSANYAHFLWSTGGEDTCYPLGDCDT